MTKTFGPVIIQSVNGTATNETETKTMTEANASLRRHLLLTAEIERNIPKLYAHENTAATEVPIAAKFFSPYSNWTWYATEGERQSNGDFLFFGYVDGQYGELGYFTLSELASVTVHGGTPAVERDCHYTPQTLAEARSQSSNLPVDAHVLANEPVARKVTS